jgi:hypothetical protein
MQFCNLPGGIRGSLELCSRGIHLYLLLQTLDTFLTYALLDELLIHEQGQYTFLSRPGAP